MVSFSPVPSRTLPISPITLTPVAKDACARIRIPVPKAGIEDVVAQRKLCTVTVVPNVPGGGQEASVVANVLVVFIRGLSALGGKL